VSVKLINALKKVLEENHIGGRMPGFRPDQSAILCRFATAP